MVQVSSPLAVGPALTVLSMSIDGSSAHASSSSSRPASSLSVETLLNAVFACGSLLPSPGQAVGSDPSSPNSNCSGASAMTVNS